MSNPTHNLPEQDNLTVVFGMGQHEVCTGGVCS